jgi:prepilin-type N-terminal cleavage/methylation domain-containing protein/prepilin-type processing-associated H-X9-DG protein
MNPPRALPRGGRDPRRRAFTLVELIVVVGIVALLIGILLPAVNRARRQGRLIQCANNVRQICVSVFAYAAEYHGKFPPSRSDNPPAQFWHNVPIVGKSLSDGANFKGGPLSCPDDADARRSYSMNVWASGQIDGVTVPAPALGELWGPANRNSSVMLIVEAYSVYESPNAGRVCPSVVGVFGATPGKRFGVDGGVGPLYGGPWGWINCELDFARHRPPTLSVNGPLPVGSLNIGYADGHVSLKSNAELADPVTGKSTLDSLWSPWDAMQNQ